MKSIFRTFLLTGLAIIALSCGSSGSSGGGGGGGDTTPPDWTASYPTDITPGTTGASGSVSISEDGTVYYIVTASDASAPNSDDVKAGVDYDSITVIGAGSVTVTAATAKSFSISGLTAATSYAIHFAAEDSSGNLQTAVASKTFTTSATTDTTPPTWTSGYPALSYTGAETVKFKVSVTEGGKVYYIVADSSASTPTSAQVKSAAAYGPNIHKSGSISVTPGTEYEITASALQSGTEYDIWVVAEDMETTPNIMASATKLDVTTTGIPEAVTGENFATATYANGARRVSSGVWTIATYSKNATRIIVELYDAPYGEDAKYSFELTRNTTDNIWRIKLKNLPEKFYYAYRAWGPNWTYDASWTRGNSDKGFIADVDASGNRFNPNKVLYDPYSFEMSHDKSNPAALGSENAGMYGTGGIADATSHGYSGPCTGNVNIDRRKVDTGKFAPKSVAFVDTTSFGTKPAIAQKDAIIYEAHVRGLTKHSSASVLKSTILTGFSGFDDAADVPADYRGTYKGAAYMAGYLKGLGINTIEFLPVHETDNDHNPADASGGNYWGYMTYSYFAPDRRYAFDKSPGGPTKEFKEMMAAFHAAGIEVYLDVVYNHTGEGGNWDAAKIESPAGSGTWIDNPNFTTKCAETTSFRGLDNAEYYCLVDANKGIFWETTGCGNNFRCDNTPVRKLILDSLTYWIDEMGVDGFRFDLAPVLGREYSSGNWVFNSNATTIVNIRDLGADRDVEMIAEAWDTQWPAGYQVSNFTIESASGAKDGWGEWNGFFRDTMRKFMKGDGWKVTNYCSVGDVFHGSYNLNARKPAHNDHDHTGFNDQGGPHKSVNFITAHDGFTMMDLVSYGSKQNNGAWPFGGSDGGSNDNDSWDSNPANHPGGAISTEITQHQLRRQQLRNFWTMLMFSRGVPMVVYGDEFGRTQNGNNNTYNLDGVATWNNYTMINSDSPTAVALGDGFTGSYHNNFGTDSNTDSKNALFKFAQQVTAIRKSEIALRQDNWNMDISYTTAAGAALSDSDRAARIHMDGTDVSGNDYLLCINMWKDQVTFTIPAAEAGKKWIRIIDTAHWAEASYDNIWADPSAGTFSGTYGVNPMSILVLKEVPNP